MEDTLLKDLKKLNSYIVGHVSLDYKNMVRLNLTQIQIIRFLRMNQDVCQKDLEAETRLKKASISEALNKLEELKIIKRTPSKTDGRKNIIVLTDGVKEIFEKMDKKSVVVRNKMTENIPEKDLKIFYKTLDRMIENLKEGMNEINI